MPWWPRRSWQPQIEQVRDRLPWETRIMKSSLHMPCNTAVRWISMYILCLIFNDFFDFWECHDLKKLVQKLLENAIEIQRTYCNLFWLWFCAIVDAILIFENATTSSKYSYMLTEAAFMSSKVKVASERKNSYENRSHLSKLLYVPPILGQLPDLISPPKINISEPKFGLYDPWNLANWPATVS